MSICKIILIGPRASGKSALLYRLTERKFLDSYMSTIGTDFQTLQSKDHPWIKQNDAVQIFDATGNEQQRKNVASIIKKTNTVALVVDLDLWGDVERKNQQAVEQERLKKEIEEIKLFNQDLPIYLIGTKYDLANSKKRDEKGKSAIKAFAIECGISDKQLFITSANQINQITELKNNPCSLPETIFENIYVEYKKTQPPQEKEASKPVTITHPFYFIVEGALYFLNRIIAVPLGVSLGILITLLTHNPLTCFLSALRRTDWAEWTWKNIFRVFLFAPLINPSVALFYGIEDSGAYTARTGLRYLFDIPERIVEPFGWRPLLGTNAVVILTAGAIIAAIYLLPVVTIPLLLGIAAGTALITTAGYEGIDWLLARKEAKTFNEIIKSDDVNFEANKSFLYVNKLFSPSNENTTLNEINYLLVNSYAKNHSLYSGYSFFQLWKPLAPHFSAGSIITYTSDEKHPRFLL